MGKEFKEIVVPNPERGLTGKQRDRLQVDMAHGINSLGSCVKEINGKTSHLYSEIYGNEDYEGLKSKIYSNSRLIKWILITLLLGGAGVGAVSTVGGM